MIYRVILKVRYNEAWFDFDDIESAGEFAKTILTHQVVSDDAKPKTTISMKVIDPTKVSEDEDDD